MNAVTGRRSYGALGLEDSEQNGCIVVGVLSDTHGHLYPEVLEALRGVDHIIHAGDVGAPEVLNTLRTVGSVTAVRGNCDLGAWAEALPERVELTIGGARIVVSHLAPRISARGDATGGTRINRDIDVVVFGHSHRASIDERARVLYVNPGSAGPRRFGRARTMARLAIFPAATSGSPVGLQARPLLRASILSAEG